MKLMSLEFLGTYAELQDEVKVTGFAGEWRDLGNQKQFRANSGAILNWWQSTGTIALQGPGLLAAEFEAELFAHAIVGIKARDGRELIPTELLAGITADKIDWERSTLIDDEGRLWTDLAVSSDAFEAKRRGKIVPIWVWGRRARH